MNPNDSELRRLRAENEQLRARLALSGSTNEQDFKQSSSDFELSASPSFRHDRQGAVPRSAGTGIIVPTTQRQPDRSQESQHRMKRAKTVHVPKTAPVQAPLSSTARMARSISSRSANKFGSHMAPRPNPVSPLPLPPSTTGHNVPAPMLAEFIHQGPTGQPASAYVFADSLADSVTPPHPPPMGPLVESGRAYNPGEYLSLLPPYGVASELPPSTSHPIAIMPMTGMDRLSALQDQPYSQSALPSTCGSLTSGPTLETPMSRQNSQAFPDGLSGAGNLEMMRAHSQQSSSGHVRNGSLGRSQLLSPDSIFPKARGQLMEIGAGLADARFSSSAPPAQQHHAPMIKSQSQASMMSASSGDWEAVHNDLFMSADMQRSESNQSGKSLKMRAKEALQRQNAAAIRNIQPKPLASAKKEPAPPQAASAKVKEGKAPIAKTTYQRPKHPKVYCTQCPGDREGFRGEHELRRHTEAKHKSTVKKFICVEPEIEPPIKVLKPLADCKQCTAGKQYGAYYNAAAHLRRTHFKHKASRKQNKNGSKDNNSKTGGRGTIGSDEKLGGKGGGDWPSMRTLKLWMKPVFVSMDDPSAFAPDAMDANDAAELTDMVEYDTQLAEAIADQTMAEGAAPFPYDISVSGVGSGFTMSADMEGSIDGSYNALQADLGGYGAMDPAAFLAMQGAGFDFGVPLGSHDPSSLITQGLGGPIGAAGGEYASPDSSTATITPINNVSAYHAQHQNILPPSNMPAAGDDLAEMSFEMAFQIPHV